MANQPIANRPRVVGAETGALSFKVVVTRAQVELTLLLRLFQVKNALFG